MLVLGHVVLSLLLAMSVLGIPILLLVENRRHVVPRLHRTSREVVLIINLLLNALCEIARVCLSIVDSHLAE
jgi:hypothetical protein